MRDFRDAKAMAQALRESLSHKAMTISHSESLELVSKMLGLSDWNKLSALMQAERGDPAAPAAARKTSTARFPAMPLRDLVPFPTATYPLVIGREDGGGGQAGLGARAGAGAGRPAAGCR